MNHLDCDAWDYWGIKVASGRPTKALPRMALFQAFRRSFDDGIVQGVSLAQAGKRHRCSTSALSAVRYAYASLSFGSRGHVPDVDDDENNQRVTIHACDRSHVRSASRSADLSATLPHGMPRGLRIVFRLLQAVRRR